MTLEDILALRPSSGDSNTYRTALAKADLARKDLAVKAGELDRVRARGLLNVDDTTLLKAEQDAAAARLAVERIDALLPMIRDDLAKAEGAETLTELRAGAGAVQKAVAALETWQRTQFPKLTAIMAEGFRLEDEAKAERDAYLERVRGEYARPEVREAGPLGVEVPPMPGDLPRKYFPQWQLT
ncbi:hypothetical protein J8J14_18200 [Roseomonas sp. SSH11]|uniref:Uncharacterized protein n=1 Tax=Pararoseomonas baculiformis TaxID=2820812 RepID=A0ABS4AI62_9PROT|nr:hypothetical protein [Pararoseomonas baculiformis]MBP0446712.1 hypothetical protein [Pararoseomonas baculiformis]